MTEWDNSHDWILLRHFSDEIELKVRFDEGRPSPAELVSLRKCVPTLRHEPPAELRDRIAAGGSVVLGTYEVMEGRHLERTLKSAGLGVVVIERSSVFLLPFDRTTRTALLIEDEIASAQLAEDMILAGVPVQDSIE